MAINNSVLFFDIYDLFCLYPVHYFIVYLFLKRTQRSTSQLFSTDLVLDLLLFSLATYKRVFMVPQMMKVYKESMTFDDALAAYVVLGQIEIEYFYGICLAVAWLKVLLVFKTNKLLGPFLNII